MMRFLYMVMEENPGEEGKGGAGGGTGVEDLVDLKYAEKTFKVPKEVSQLFGKINSELRTTNTELKTLKEAAQGESPELAALRDKLNELELQKLPEKERETAKLKSDYLKLNTDFATISKKAERYEVLFKENAINTALNEALAGHDLYHPQQALQLLKAVGQPKLFEDQNGSYKITLNLDFDGNGLQEFDTKEGIAKWLGLPQNANLLKNNLQPGAGTSVKGGLSQPGGGLAFKRADLQNPEIRQQYQAALKQGKDVTII